MKRLLLAVVPLMLLAPPAQATHCNAISIYSGFRADPVNLSWDPVGSLGCPSDDNTDLLLPGSSYARVFVDGAPQPLDGIAQTDGSATGSSLLLGGGEVPLTWTRGAAVNGNPADFWFTPEIAYPIQRSVEPGFIARARVCYAVDDCIERTYRTATTL